MSPTKNDVIVSDYGNHCVKVFSINGRFRFKFGGIGKEIGKLIHPMGVCTDRYGNIFVADRDNHRVQMFDRTGKHVSCILENTFEDGKDIRPRDVAITAESLLVVLIKGIEGVDFAEIRIYQMNCSLPPPEARSLEEILSTVHSMRVSSTAPRPSLFARRTISSDVKQPTPSGSNDRRDRLPDLLERNHSRDQTTPMEDKHSSVCIIV